MGTISIVCWNIWILRFGVNSFLMCGCWGLLDTVINVQLFRILGFEFESHSVPFGTYNLFQGMFVFFGAIVQSLISEENWVDLMVWTGVVGFLAIASIAALLMFPYKQKYDELPEEEAIGMIGKQRSDI